MAITKTEITATINIHKKNMNIEFNKFLLNFHSNKCLLKYMPGGFNKTRLKKANIDVAK